MELACLETRWGPPGGRHWPGWVRDNVPVFKPVTQWANVHNACSVKPEQLNGIQHSSGENVSVVLRCTWPHTCSLFLLTGHTVLFCFFLLSVLFYFHQCLESLSSSVQTVCEGTKPPGPVKPLVIKVNPTGHQGKGSLFTLIHVLPPVELLLLLLFLLPCLDNTTEYKNTRRRNYGSV